LTCFQFCSAVPMPKILERTKHASFPKTFIPCREHLWCHRYALTSSPRAASHMYLWEEQPHLLTKLSYSSQNVSMSFVRC
jgi:hypothetical protein